MGVEVPNDRKPFNRNKLNRGELLLLHHYFEVKKNELHVICTDSITQNDFSETLYDESKISRMAVSAEKFADTLEVADERERTLLKSIFLSKVCFFLKNHIPLNSTSPVTSDTFNKSISHLLEDILTSYEHAVTTENQYKETSLPTVGAEIEILNKKYFFYWQRDIYIYNPYRALMLSFVNDNLIDSGNVESSSTPFYSPEAVAIWLEAVELVTDSFLRPKYPEYDIHFEHPIHLNYAVAVEGYEDENHLKYSYALQELFSILFVSQQRINGRKYVSNDKGPVVFHPNNTQVEKNRLREGQISRMEYRVLHSQKNINYRLIASRLQSLSYLIELENRSSKNSTEKQLLMDWQDRKNEFVYTVFPRLLRQYCLIGTENDNHDLNPARRDIPTQSSVLFNQVAKLLKFLKQASATPEALQSKNSLKFELRGVLDSIHSMVGEALDI